MTTLRTAEITTIECAGGCGRRLRVDSWSTCCEPGELSPEEGAWGQRALEVEHAKQVKRYGESPQTCPDCMENMLR